MKIDISIKNRLKISSVFMLVMIVAFGLSLFFGGRMIYLELRDESLDPDKTDPDYFLEMVAATKKKYLESWTGDSDRGDFDINKMLAQASAWNERFEKDDFSLAVYKDRELLTQGKTAIEENLAALLFSKSGEHFMFFDSLALFTTTIGEYNVAMMYNGFSRNLYYDDENKGTLNLLTATGTILLTLFFVNLFLMRFVARPINLAMTTLMDGIRHIRDGDLDYEIVYPGHDEFAEICSDFNEMTWRLRDSINRIQHEEQARRELIAGISHDLHTPLASIKAYVEGLAKGVANTPEKQQHYLGTLNRKTEIMEKIIDQLFTFSKLDLETFPMHLSRADLGQEIVQVVDELKDEYRESNLLIDVAENLPNADVDMDKTLFRNIFRNILENSLKYKGKYQDRVNVAVGLRRKNDHVEITLEDDGPGVEEDEIVKIFDIFYRCDKSRTDAEKGSGLGLAIASKAVTRFGGTIWAENAAGGGLAIKISLPVRG
jgi:signal transduction histidine kinase